MLYRVEGIVIRSTDYGEGNKIVTLLTLTHGKQGIVVRGARKPKSRFGAMAQLFTYGDYSFYKTGSLGTLNSAEALDPFRALREGLELPAYAAYACELTDRGTTEEDASAWLFHQLKACLTALAEGKDPDIVLRVYEMKIAVAAGYAPALDGCVSCGRDAGPMLFSARGGGLLCGSCRHRDPGAIALDEAVLKLLRLFAELDLRRLGNIALKPATKEQLRQAMRLWLDTHLGLNMKSRQFLDQLERHGELLGLGGGDAVVRERKPAAHPEADDPAGSV